MRVTVPDGETTEDNMICNNAFRAICSYLQSRPADGASEYDLHGMPFLHAENLNTQDMSIVGADGVGDAEFETGGIKDLTAVPAKPLHMVGVVEVLCLDGHRRAAVVL